MRLRVLGFNERHLAHGAAIVLVGGIVSGCSSDAMRFSYGTDGMFTGATANQRQIIAPDQPYPGDEPVPAASVDGTHTGSINRGAVTPVDLSAKPVTKAALAPVAGTKVASADSKPLVKLEGAGIDRTTTGTVESTAAKEDPVGWSRAGGTEITAKQGETVYNLSKRFGVPADVLMKMNGIAKADDLRAGQKVVVPIYVYDRKAPISAPDHNPKVAAAKSSTGVKEPGGKLPASDPSPQKLAVLPKSPKLKEGEAGQPAEAASDKVAKSGADKVAKSDADKAGKSGAEEVAKAAPGTYTVQAGDTLARIAKRNGVSVVALKQANGLGDGLLKIGQTLKVPAAGQQVASAGTPGVDPIVTGAAGPAKKADSAEVAGYTPPKAEKTIDDADVDTASAAPDSTGIGKMRWPVRGRVISAFGKGGNRSNDGIDIAVPEGTPIKAAENGVVIYAGDGLKDFGNTVLVRHDDGLVTVYGHASELEVKRGEKVKRGQEIARSGMTGTTDAPKLHFEVRKNSAPVDPTSYLE